MEPTDSPSCGGDSHPLAAPCVDPIIYGLARSLYVQLYRMNSGLNASHIAACAFDAAQAFEAEYKARVQASAGGKEQQK